MSLLKKAEGLDENTLNDLNSYVTGAKKFAENVELYLGVVDGAAGTAATLAGQTDQVNTDAENVETSVGAISTAAAAFDGKGDNVSSTLSNYADQVEAAANSVETSVSVQSAGISTAEVSGSLNAASGSVQGAIDVLNNIDLSGVDEEQRAAIQTAIESAKVQMNAASGSVAAAQGSLSGVEAQAQQAVTTEVNTTVQDTLKGIASDMRTSGTKLGSDINTAANDVTTSITAASNAAGTLKTDAALQIPLRRLWQAP